MDFGLRTELIYKFMKKGKLIMKNQRIAVLIPCYNESQTIAKVICDFKEVLPEATIYVYDNNSSDGTDEIARKNGAVVRYEHMQGKGNVVRRMFREIEADCYILVDGDDTYPAIHAKEMADLVLNDSIDMVIGDRLSTTYFTENKRRFHGFGNKIVRSMINGIFGGNVKDIMTGYRAFSRLFVKSFPIISKGFEIETEMTIYALDKNIFIKEIPIEYRDRPEGSVSKLNTISDGMKVIKMIFSLFREYKPFGFFGCIAAVLTLLSVGLFIPVFIDYLHTGLVAKFPTLIVAGFVMVAALLLWMCGLILQVIVKKQRQLTEVQMNIIQSMDNKNN